MVHGDTGKAAGTSADLAAAAAELEQLRRDFPRYAIGSVTTWGHTRYLGQRRQPGPGPHTVLTADLAELRAALSEVREKPGT